MRNIVFLAVLFLASCVESSEPVSYEQVPVKVVFEDGTVDTLTVSGNHELVLKDLREYPNQTAGPKVRAHGVKYVKRIKYLETNDKNQ